MDELKNLQNRENNVCGSICMYIIYIIILLFYAVVFVGLHHKTFTQT